MRAVRWMLRVLLLLFGIWMAATLAAGWWLPELLLNPPSPDRTEVERQGIMAALAKPDGCWTHHAFQGPEGGALELHWLHRPRRQGVLLFLHGFGDDAFGTLGYAAQFPEWEAASFTFRGRGLASQRPCSLGAWESKEVVCAVAVLENAGVPRSQLALVGVSQGAGVALLALEHLESEGRPLLGALLESPFQDLPHAARNHLRGALGRAEPWARGAEWLALWNAGRWAGFDPCQVSPLKAASRIRTPLALLTGDVDVVTPLEGVQAIAEAAHAPLEVVRNAGHNQAGSHMNQGFGGWAKPWLSRWRTRDTPPISRQVAVVRAGAK
jgi:alpha-beta hydrolase superfamily lysophospholipase